MTRETKTITVVHCAKFDKDLPALDNPPFPGPLGQRIFENVSELAWSMWSEQSTLIINHYGLNMADPQAQELIFEQMEQFLFNADAQSPQISGAPAKGGAPRK